MEAATVSGPLPGEVMIDELIRGSVQTISGFILALGGWSLLALGSRPTLWVVLRLIGCLGMGYAFASILVSLITSSRSTPSWWVSSVISAGAASVIAAIGSLSSHLSNTFLSLSAFALASIIFLLCILLNFISGFVDNEVAAIEFALFATLLGSFVFGTPMKSARKDSHRWRFVLFSSFVGGFLVSDGINALVYSTVNDSRLVRSHSLIVEALQGHTASSVKAFTQSSVSIALIASVWVGVSVMGLIHQSCMRWGLCCYGKWLVLAHENSEDSDESIEILAEGQKRSSFIKTATDSSSNSLKSKRSLVLQKENGNDTVLYLDDDFHTDGDEKRASLSRVGNNNLSLIRRPQTLNLAPGATLEAQMPQPSTEAQALRICRVCGHENEESAYAGHSYCTECGDRFEDDDEENPENTLSLSAMAPPQISTGGDGIPSRWKLDDKAAKHKAGRFGKKRIDHDKYDPKDPTSIYRESLTQLDEPLSFYASNMPISVAPTVPGGKFNSKLIGDVAISNTKTKDFGLLPHAMSLHSSTIYSKAGGRPGTTIMDAEPLTTPNIRRYKMAGTKTFRIFYILSTLAGFFWLANLFRFFPQEQPCYDSQPRLSCEEIDQVIVLSRQCEPSSTSLNPSSGSFVCVRNVPAMRWVVYVMFVFSELLNFFLGLFYFFNMWMPVRRGARMLDQMCPELPKSQWPTVDIFLCHYTEPVEDTIRTLKSVFALQYPPELLHIFILDDGYCKSTWDVHNRFKVVVNQGVISAAGDCRAEVAKFIYSRLNPGSRASVQELQEWRKTHTYIREMKNSIDSGLGVARRDCGVGSIGDDYDYRSRGFPRLTFVGRMKPEIHHSKAGNINNCLYNEGADGKYILILDNDMKPHSNFLLAVLPFFFGEGVDADGNVTYSDDITWNQCAFVQTPQYFEDSEQIVVMGDPCGHKNTIFFDAVQCGRDGYDAAAFAGTNAVFRRQALDSIGGIQYGTQTEDAWTGNCLHNAGWDSYYFRKDFEGSPQDKFRLCVGSIPATVAASMGQRKRWAKGAIQILLMDKHKSEVDPDWRPPKVKSPPPRSGVAFPRTMFYLDSVLYPFGSLGALFFMVIAIYYMCTGYPPIYTEGLWLLYAFLPYISAKWILNLLANRAVDNNDVWRAQQTWFSYAFCTLLAMIEAVQARVTGVEKSWANTGAGQKTSILEVPNVMMFFALGCSLIVNLVRFFEYENATSPWNATAAAFFGAFIMTQLWPMARMSIREYAGWDQTTTTFSAAFLGTFLLIAVVAMVSLWQTTFDVNLAVANGLS